MKNKFFNVFLDKESGCITGITNLDDTHEMNWCSDLTQWGKINIKNRIESE